MLLAHELWDRWQDRELKPDESYVVLRRTVARGLIVIGQSSTTVAKYIGGVSTLRDHAGSPRPPLNPISAAQQREALDIIATGLFSADTDTGTVTGPLANLVADKWIDRFTHFHEFWVNVLLILIGLHVLAAIFYLVGKRQNLIGAMFTGRKPLDQVVVPGKPAPTLTFASGRLAVSLLIVAAAIVYFIVRVGG